MSGSGALNLGIWRFFCAGAEVGWGSAGGYLRVWEDICEFRNLFATLLGLFAGFLLYLRLGAEGVARLSVRLAGRESCRADISNFFILLEVSIKSGHRYWRHV